MGELNSQVTRRLSNTVLTVAFYGVRVEPYWRGRRRCPFGDSARGERGLAVFTPRSADRYMDRRFQSDYVRSFLWCICTWGGGNDGTTERRRR
eukprot:5601027-Pyramimonas_sp.AAC.3